MFDNDASGSIDVFEFEKLYNYINQWLQVFKTYDADGSGHIEESELIQGKTESYINRNKINFCFPHSLHTNGLPFHARVHKFSSEEE